MTGAPLEWSYRPWRDRPRAAGVAALFGLAGCLAVILLGESAVLTVGLCAAVLASLSPVLSPARCRLDEAGVSRHNPLGPARRSWSELRRGSLGPDWLLVSPYARPSWLDPYRGLLLPLPRRDRATLSDEIRRRLASHGL